MRLNEIYSCDTSCIISCRIELNWIVLSCFIWSLLAYIAILVSNLNHFSIVQFSYFHLFVFVPLLSHEIAILVSSPFLASSLLNDLQRQSTLIHLTSTHSISLHLTASHCISHYLTPSHSISLHLTPFHWTSLHLAPPHSISLHLTPSHSTSLYLTPSHSTSLHLTPSHSISLYLTPPHSISLHLTANQPLPSSFQFSAANTCWSPVGTKSPWTSC